MQKHVVLTSGRPDRREVCRFFVVGGGIPCGSLPFSNEITVGAACCKTSDLMKTLNETFTDDEYETMLRVKKESGLN